MNKLAQNEKGFTLLEMTVTVFILTVGILGMYGAITRTIAQSSEISNRLIASYLAQEGIEIVRNLRDGNWVEEEKTGMPIDWDTGFDTCSFAEGGCEADFNETTSMSAYGVGSLLYIDTDGFYRYTGAPYQTKFKRKIIIEDLAVDTVNVKIEIRWRDQMLAVEENLYNWK